MCVCRCKRRRAEESPSHATSSGSEEGNTRDGLTIKDASQTTAGDAEGTAITSERNYLSSLQTW